MNKESFLEDITNVKQFALGSMRQARQFRATKMGIFLLKISNNKPNPCGLSFQYIITFNQQFSFFFFMIKKNVFFFNFYFVHMHSKTVKLRH